MERKYHLSFEQKQSNPIGTRGTIDIKTITNLIDKLGGKNITYPCSNTIIFTYKNDTFDMDTFKDEISKYFFITLSLIGTDESTEIYLTHPNTEINYNPSKKINERINLGKMFK